jgi:hypothetical protein
MKKLFLVIVIYISAQAVKAQILKLSTVEEIKESKIVVSLTEDEKLNEIWKSAIQERWGFTEIIDFVPEDAAFDKLKAKEVDYVLYLNTKYKARSRTYNNNGFRYVYENEGMSIELRDRKRTYDALQFIPPFGDDNEYADAFVNFGIDALQYQFEVLIKNNLKSNLTAGDEYNEYASELKDKTLLILSGWIHKKTTIEEVKELYDGSIEVVPFEDWKEAILEKQEDRAYVVVVPHPMGRTTIYLHYLMDAATGRVLGLGHPKRSFGVFGYSKGNSGFINEKNLEIYNELIE